MKKLLSSLLISSLLAGFTACSTTADLSEAYKGETPKDIYAKGRAALQDKSYNEAVKRFEALDIQYPFGVETENAQLYLIYAYYMKEDYTLASGAAERFIRLHPTNRHVDYAYYMRGLSDYYQNLGIIERLFTVDLATRDLTQIQKSYQDFNELIFRFPSSPYVPSAHQYLIYLRNMLANHELQTAEYYYNRKAYVAAANRGSGVVAHFQGSDAVLGALTLMAKSYHQLGEKQLEQDTLRILKYNYPNIH
jgi:outer membrane protein assembly factor BamD